MLATNPSPLHLKISGSVGTVLVELIVHNMGVNPCRSFAWRSAQQERRRVACKSKVSAPWLNLQSQGRLRGISSQGV